jgi:spore coat protein U domain-containing protein, fimbrial subunit CupE1/2/3/6
MVLAGALVALPALPARAQDITCVTNNTTINFGTYDVLGGSTLPGTGTITVTCTNTRAPRTTVNYVVKLAVSPAKQMAPPAGTDRVTYALYVDSARTQIWGDGTGSTHTFTGSLRPQRNSSLSAAPVTYYGLITPGGQDVSAASPGPPPTTYSQNLTITVTCTPSPPC